MTRSENVHVANSDVSRACDNPDCTNRVGWSNQAGRPQTFCSPNCRQRARHASTRVRASIKRLERSLSGAAVTYRQRRELESQLAQQRWLLSAYPPSLQP